MLATPIDPDKDWFAQDEIITVASQSPDHLSHKLYDEIQ